MRQYYLAPLEGITGFIFRNTVFECFPEGITKYFTPFLMPHTKRVIGRKDLKDILPENNVGIPLVPQILTNDAEGFVLLAKEIRNLGYDEININLGCPSQTVCAKGRGSGFLLYPSKLDRFLDIVFNEVCGPISIKTRIGSDSPDEFGAILDIYNKYPIHELTIHPRIRREQYNGTVHLDAFCRALENSSNPLCYNGDICSTNDLQMFIQHITAQMQMKECSLQIETETDLSEMNAEQSQTDYAIMIGRGMIANPGLIRELSTGKQTTCDEITMFLSRLRDAYRIAFSGDMPVLYKMKEVWVYMQNLFPEDTDLCKKILKCKDLSTYLMYEKRIMNGGRIHTDVLNARMVNAKFS